MSAKPEPVPVRLSSPSKIHIHRGRVESIAGSAAASPRGARQPGSPQTKAGWEAARKRLEKVLVAAQKAQAALDAASLATEREAMHLSHSHGAGTENREHGDDGHKDGGSSNEAGRDGGPSPPIEGIWILVPRQRHTEQFEIALRLCFCEILV